MYIYTYIDISLSIYLNIHMDSLCVYTFVIRRFKSKLKKKVHPRSITVLTVVFWGCSSYDICDRKTFWLKVDFLV